MVPFRRTEPAGSQKPEESGDVAIEDSVQLKEPPKHAVVLHNDDFTTMEFVIEVLQKFFRKTHDEAMKIMWSVHHNGSGVAGIYPVEIAEMKVVQVTAHAQQHGFPLRATSEPAP